MSGRYDREDSDEFKAEKFRKLFIGGLNYKTTETSVEEYFKQWGEIVDCVVPRDLMTKRSRGIGFITYKTAEMLDNAQNNRPHMLDDRALDTKRAIPHSKSNESQSSVKRMFVGGLKGDVSEDDVREVFGHFGKIEKLEMIKNKNTGKRKGFCFITFDDFDSVDKCVLRERISLNGNYVDVQKAYIKDGGRSGRDDTHGGMKSRGGTNSGCGYQGIMSPPGNMGRGSGPTSYSVGNQCGNDVSGNQGHQAYGGRSQGGNGFSGNQGPLGYSGKIQCVNSSDNYRSHGGGNQGYNRGNANSGNRDGRYDGSGRDFDKGGNFGYGSCGNQGVNGSRRPQSYRSGNQAPAVYGGGKQAPAVYGGGNQAPAVYSRGNQAPAVYGGGNQAPAVYGGGKQAPAIYGGGKQAPAVYGGRNQAPAVYGGRNQAPAVYGGRNQAPAVYGGGNQAPAVYGGGNQAPAVYSGGNQAPAVYSGGNQAPAVYSGGNQAPAVYSGGNLGYSGGNQAPAVYSGGNQAPTVYSGGNLGYSGGNQAPAGYSGGSQAPAGYGGGNQGGNGSAGNQSSYSSGNDNSGNMGARYGGSSSDFNNFGSGYGSGYNSGPTRGAVFAQKVAGPYGNCFSSVSMGIYRC